MTDRCGLDSGDQILVSVLNYAVLPQTAFKLANPCKALEHYKHSINVS